MPNRLAHETSPYLLQHAHNPVDWWPWGPEALGAAKSADKPILLSIGYAACHWCHVMERESFEDEATARLMNDRFVNIKVDREERPDIDAIYMQAVQAMTGHGGWPMTMFLTPDGVPFYGGTYFPREDRHGMPSFRRILSSVADAYATNRGAVDRTTATIREMYAQNRLAVEGGRLSEETFSRALASLAATYDDRHSGFGGAPKFPPTMTLEWLLTRWARTGEQRALSMSRDTFLAMARGGIYDQIGGGLARYSVDEEWLVPHFEKMLYDNALFVRLGVHLWQATQEDEIRRVVEDTIEWLRREMTSPEGGFYASLDADSEGHEGKYYVWSSAEFDVALLEAGARPDEARALREFWDVSEDGNFEGSTILRVTRPIVRDAEDDARFRALRDRLYAIRERRVRPARDEKQLAGWIGLMLRGVAEAARAFGDAEYRGLAIQAAGYLAKHRVTGNRVNRSIRGRDAIPGVLEDHAAVGLAFLSVYELTFDQAWLDRARSLSQSMIEHFWDEATGTFYDTADDGEALIVRPHDLTDNAIPSGASLAIDLLARIGILTADDAMVNRARRVVDSVAEPMARHPLAFGHLMCVADMLMNGSIELALAGDPSSEAFQALASAANRVYVPSMIVAGGGSDVALMSGRTTVGSRAAAYVCRNFACDRPTTDPVQLSQQLSLAGRR